MARNINLFNDDMKRKSISPLSHDSSEKIIISAKIIHKTLLGITKDEPKFIVKDNKNVEYR